MRIRKEKGLIRAFGTHGEVAYLVTTTSGLAEELFARQKRSNGRDPRDWQDPVAAAEEEIQIMGGE